MPSMEYGSRELPIKRKRKGGQKEEAWAGIDMREDVSDTGSDVSDTVECWKCWKESGKPPTVPLSDYKHSPPAYGQGLMYLFIVLSISIFIYVVNNYNAKQLERIKEEYGMDMKAPAPELWWQHALSYHVLVRSFKDTNADGIGDLNGLRLNANYFVYLGVDCVILSRLLESPFTDFGRDVSNFTAIDPVYGSLDDFTHLVDEFHEQGIKVMLELNPNQSSRKHAYFEASRRRQEPYQDYYVWQPGTQLANGTRLPPNNWVSKYGGSAWSWDNVRNEYYYHHYHATMPDFNYREQRLHSELKGVLEWWMARGVDGFYLDGAHLFYEVDDPQLDEPENDNTAALMGEYDYLKHVYTVGQPEIHDLTIAMRDWIEQYSVTHDLKVALLLHIDSEMHDILKYYNTGAHASISLNLMEIDASTNGRDVYDLVDSYKSLVPPERQPVWMMSHPDKGLLNSKTGVSYQNVLNMLMLLLPGAAVTYMGEELALPALPPALLPSNIYRTSRQQATACAMPPLPWNRNHNGGFSKVPPWLPARPDFDKVNVELEMQEQQRIMSPLQLYGRLARMRKEISFVQGETQYGHVDDDVYSYMRFAKNSAAYMLVVNIGANQQTVDLTLTAGVQYGKVMAYGTPVRAHNFRRAFKEEQTIDLHQVTIRPGEGVVLLLILEIVMDMDAQFV